MQPVLRVLAFLLLFAIPALADSTVGNLSTNAQLPLPANTCVYVDMAGTDTKLCDNFANAFGLSASDANTWFGNATASAGDATANAFVDCPDTAGNHLNHAAGANITCGNSSATIAALARTHVNPSDPTGNSTATPVMMGLGATATITPLVTGNVYVSIVGTVTNSADNGTESYQIRCGTGTAPSNGDALAGTAYGATQSPNANVHTEVQSFAIQAYFTGPLTAHWCDLSLARGSAGTASIASLDVWMQEN